MDPVFGCANDAKGQLELQIGYTVGQLGSNVAGRLTISVGRGKALIVSTCTTARARVCLTMLAAQG